MPYSLGNTSNNHGELQKYTNRPYGHLKEINMSYLITENCIICGTCWEICPTESIKEFDWYYKIADTCVECGACARVCPNAAIAKKSA
jgi:ferredoxin